MLACARIGAPHSVVFGGFAAKELASRISHAQPSLIISTNCGIEPNRIVPYKPMLDEAIQISGVNNIIKCLIYNRNGFTRAELQPRRDTDWDDAMSKVNKGHDPVSLSSLHPLYILYTSGTTGRFSVCPVSIWRYLFIVRFQVRQRA